MMKKLLITLLMLCLLPCAYAEELSVHIHDLTDMTLLTQSSESVPEDFLRLCPEADAETVRCITPEYVFLQYNLSSTEVYATPDGTAWVMKDESVFRLTDPGCRVTSIHPVILRVISYWQSDKGLLYTQQRGSETDVRCLDLQTGEITTLLTTDGSLVIVAPLLDITYTVYTPLPDYSGLLLCTAQITQADASDPALTVTLEKVVGDITSPDEAYAANLRQNGHVIVEYGGERADSLEAFAAVYRRMYPDHNLSDPAGSICDRTYLTGNPAYGRLYEVTFNNRVFLWKDGQAHEISDAVSNFWVTGLAEAALTDLNGDGTEEVVCVFSAGSGFFCHIAAVYDPVTRTGTELYSSLIEGEADELHLRMEAGACQLYQGDALLGTVTKDGLDTPGLSMVDFAGLVIGQSTYEDACAICPEDKAIATARGLVLTTELADGTTLSLTFDGPEMVLAEIKQVWHGLTLLNDGESFAAALAEPVDEAALLAMIETRFDPAAFAEAGLLTHAARTPDMGMDYIVSCVRTEDTLYALGFLPMPEGDWLLVRNTLPLNHDRSALEAIQPGMTLEEVQAISPDEAQYPFLYTGVALPAESTHVLPTGEVLTVRYEYAEGECIVVSVEWDAL